MAISVNLVNFNSRPSARGDAAMADISAIGKISIHAPPRGATMAEWQYVLPVWHFNSRPSARGDEIITSKK